MVALKRNKKVNIVVKDATVMKAVILELRILGCDIFSDIEKVKDSDIVIFDPYFLELGLINVISKENPLLVLVMVGSQEDFKRLGHLPCLCFCDKVVIEDHRNNVGKKVAEWFLKNYGRDATETGGERRGSS